MIGLFLNFHVSLIINLLKMEREKESAILLGATGLVGSHLLERLLEDEHYSQVKVFSRRPVGLSHPKLTEVLIDLFELENYREEFTADVVFVCIGTTRKKTPDLETYKKVDYGIPYTAAKLASRNGIKKFLVVSALGADAGSRIFYSRTKGEMEEAVLAQKIPKTYIFQPSLITGDRKETRMGESAGEKIMKVVNPLLFGSWKKYRSIKASTIAASMHRVARHGFYANRIPSDEIQDIADHYQDIKDRKN